MTRPATVGDSIVNWFMPVVPQARIAILRTVIYLFVIIDMHLIVRDPIPLSRQPELYSPLMVARLFHLPTPSPAITITLYVVLWVSCLVAAANRVPRLAGLVVAAAFTWWTSIGMGYGKVDHDHLALMVALWVLPTAGVVAGRWRDTEPSARAGWALKCIQIAVVSTYFLSAITKIRSGGWSVTSWPNSAILMWAIIRRPHGLGQYLMDYPMLLRGMQWMAFLAELTSLVVLWLRGRALLVAALFWLSFHVFTVAILYIHFAPTLVCWLAFAPLERCAPRVRRVVASRRERAGRGAARQPMPVGRDQAVDHRS
ncbi:MAG: hypothetical protein AVDCRST_MAG75-1386 [uncultured Propionibacteriaceae bacterium]|uniref:HTTM domain-containing protein n=1 Tax=uncultured Propionibacteriaceae bacterium TaxID=257457 RepID=A0A6J4NHD0_9ACTN|nr:MAG: hypothetical protein AVDCRST_MAG75-1386 [uncultured Propionibacteriaceae bacterium]